MPRVQLGAMLECHMLRAWPHRAWEGCAHERPFVPCYVCARLNVSAFEYRVCDGLAPLTVNGADQALAVPVPKHATWYLLDDDGVFAWCIGTWVYGVHARATPTSTSAAIGV
jgi:hypothetical protein